MLNGLSFFSLRIYDIVTIDFTNYNFSNSVDLTTQEAIKRIFLGVQRCQVIGISPTFENGDIQLKLRQCDSSTEIDRIINNKSYFYDHMLYYNSAYFLTCWNNYSGSGEIVSALDGNTKYISIGNNSGNDMQWVYNDRLIIRDNSAVYEIRAIVRQTLGVGTCYIGIEGVASDGITMVDINGANNHASQHYFAANGVSLGATWTEYKGYFQGSAGAGNGGQHNNFYAPGTVHTNAYYIRGMFIVNYSGVAGTTDIKEFQIRKITP